VLSGLLRPVEETDSGLQDAGVQLLLVLGRLALQVLHVGPAEAAAKV
jgi:hypothetical protein